MRYSDKNLIRRNRRISFFKKTIYYIKKKVNKLNLMR